MSLISELKAIQDRHGYLPEEEFQDPFLRREVISPSTFRH